MDMPVLKIALSASWKLSNGQFHVGMETKQGQKNQFPLLP